MQDKQSAWLKQAIASIQRDVKQFPSWMIKKLPESTEIKEKPMTREERKD